MRMALPHGTKIMVQAKRDMQRYASEFVSFITSEGLSDSPIQCHLYGFNRTDTSPPVAAENVYREHRRTIEGNDILVAMENTGFEHYAAALRPYYVALLEEKKRNESSDSETKDDDTDAAAAQNGEPTESLRGDHSLGPDIPTAGDLQDPLGTTSYSSFGPDIPTAGDLQDPSGTTSYSSFVPDIPTAGDLQDTSGTPSYSSFPWVNPASLDPWVYPWVLPPENADAE